MSAAAAAQTAAEGTIRGVVRDEQGGVLPGVTIEASSPDVAGVTVAVTDASGGYRLLTLSPAVYTLRAELAGFARYERAGVIVRAGLNIAIDAVLSIAALHDTVQVTAESPMLEVQNPVQAVNISGELQRSLPMGSRKDFSDFLELTPGVAGRTLDQGSGGQVYMLRGSEIDNHVVQIDGADVGSFRQGLAGLYVGLGGDTLQDTQVKTGGADASTPLGVGVIVNIATPTGTDRFKGAATAMFQPTAWNGNNASAGAQSGYSRVLQMDGSLGGPIVKRKVTFFGSVRRANREVGISRTASQTAALAAVDPSFTPFANGGVGNYTFAKVTARATANHEVFAFVQRDFVPEVAGFPTDARPFNISAFGGNSVAARWSSVWGSSATSRLLISYNDKSFNGSFRAFDGHTSAEPERDTYSTSFVSGGRRVGSGFLGQFDNTLSLTAAPTSKLTLQGDLTFFIARRGGSHELQTGFLAQPHLSNETQVRYPNGGAAFEERALTNPNDLSSPTVTFHSRVYDATAVTSSSRVAKDYDVYVTDAWRPTSRLTLNLGVRADMIIVDDRLYGVQVQHSLEVGPRAGATYVLTADAMNILRLNFGRIADLPQSTYLPTAGGNPIGFTDYYDNDLNGVFETALRSPSVTPENSNLRVDPGRHQPFVDEWIGGYRRQWRGQLSMDVSVVRRAYKDRPAVEEINRIIDGVRFVGYRNESMNDIYLVTNNTWNSQIYTGVEVTVAKKTRSLNLLGGYTRGWQHLDGTWIPGDPASFIQPDAFANDRGIGSIRGNEPNSLSGSADTRSPSWQQHALRAGASYVGPWKTRLASNLSFLSGPYSGPIVTRIAAPDPAFGPPIVTLSNGRQVANPLATTLRFAYADRGQGQIKAPNLITWSIRVGRDIVVDGHRIELAFDLINVTNRGAAQQFQNGGNQLYNTTNYAIAPDGTFRGQSSQLPRSAQVSIRYAF